MKTLLIVLALALVGCGEGYYGGSYDRSYGPQLYKAPPIKTYNETFPALKRRVERNRMAIEEMERGRRHEAVMKSITGWRGRFGQ